MWPLQTPVQSKISDDAGMRMLLPRELKDQSECRVNVCTPDELRSQPERAIGALVVGPQGHLPRVRTVLSPAHPVLPITYSSARTQIETIRHLADASLIAVVSVSPYFLEMARGLLAPAVGRRHSMERYLMARGRVEAPAAADVVVCDVITYPLVRSRLSGGIVLLYRLISTACLGKIASMMTRPAQGTPATPRSRARSRAKGTVPP